MKLRTEIEIEPFREKIDYESRIFTIGSCFAQRIGGAMERAKFRVTANPVGTLFNPMSVCAAIERLANQRFITEDELIQNNLGWYHFDFHSSLCAPTKQQTLHNINQAIEQGYRALIESDWVVITLGTSWVYRLVEGDRLVANCHKLPARDFRRVKLYLDQIVESLSDVVESHLRDKSIIFTVSPIRHVADGLSENSLSKATLRLAIDEITSRYRNAQYFPAYEALIDDLRDYRFYADDMVHPSDIAVGYIWDLFCGAAMSDSTRGLMTRAMRVVKAAEHRAQNPTSEAHKVLCRQQLKAIGELSQIDFAKESQYFEEPLKSE